MEPCDKYVVAKEESNKHIFYVHRSGKYVVSSVNAKEAAVFNNGAAAKALAYDLNNRGVTENTWKAIKLDEKEI